MPDRKKALIAGATGVAGRNLLRHLLSLDDWDVIAVSRRKPDAEGRYEHVAVDLLDRAQTFEALKRPRGVTHVFFSAYIERYLGGDGRADRCGVIFPCCGGRPIGEGADKRRRGLKPERFGCLKIDNEIEFGRLYNWEDVT